MSAALTPAREALKAAIGQHQAAAEALQIDRKAHAIALAGSEAADRKVAALAASDREAGADLATRIKAAVSTGRKPVAAVKVAERGSSRVAAESAAASANAALKVLTDDLAASEQEERNAAVALGGATQAVFSETVAALAADAVAAVATLRRIRWTLFGIETAGYASGPEGIRRLPLPSDAAAVMRWEFDAADSGRLPAAGGAVAAEWQAYRERLLIDPMAPPPELAG